MAGFYEFVEVGIQRMMRESGQIHKRSGAIGSFGEHDSEDFRRDNGVFIERFIKISYPEQQHGIGIPGFDGLMLLHQGVSSDLLLAMRQI